MNLRNGFSTNLSVQFHEVDSMNIAHHSYYIYWMEKSRFNFATSELGLGFSYQELDELKFGLPVTKLESKYIRPASFGQNITVYLKMVEREEAILTFYYEMWEEENNIKLFEGMTEHVFLNKQGKLLLHYPDTWMHAIETAREDISSYLLSY